MTAAGGGAATRSPPLASAPVAVMLIIAVAVATRIVAWWNPVAHVDNQFYLLAGEELLRGHWPYVDVWDRKPLGLFLLYAGIAWVGNGTILGLNLIATGFAAATALVIRQVSLRFASPTSAALVALIYLLVLPLFGGQTGQSPVFYNLLMACAAWLLFRATDQSALAGIRTHALAAMLLCGMSMTIKQVTFVEGACFGPGFLWLLRRGGADPLSIILTGALMIAVALLPTGLALTGYAAAGSEPLREFIYANFISIFERESWGLTAKAAGLGFFLLYLFPLLVMAVVGARDRWEANQRGIQEILLIAWLGAAFLGYLAVPAFFDHYALPVLVPACISAATFFNRPSGWLYFLGLFVFCLFQGAILNVRLNQAEARNFAELSKAVDRARAGGCIYVADGPSRLYSTTSPCRLTRFLFPTHLHSIAESNAVGVDTADELALILAQRPAVIVTKDRNPRRNSDASRVIIKRTLEQSYHQVHAVPRNARSRMKGVRVWQRNDLVR